MGAFILSRAFWVVASHEVSPAALCWERSQLPLLDECLVLTYNAIEFGEEHHISSRKGMKGFYQTLKQERIPSCYKVAAITRACAVIKSRKKSENRGIGTRHGKPLRAMVCIISGFFITAKGRLFVPLRRDEYFDIQLNPHVVETLEGKEVRSLTITPGSFSFCYSLGVEERLVKAVYGVDRNEKNLTFGDEQGVVQIDMTECVRIMQTTREVIGSFRRDDARVRRRLARKYWNRCSDRTNQMLHKATNFIVDSAFRNDAAIAVEDLEGIGRMYRKGNGQGRDYRFRLNSWPHWRAKKMLEYKAAWKGVTVIPLTKSDTYGSSSECPACGEKLRSPEKGDAAHRRMLWCQRCKVWTDRDVVGALNLSKRGLARLASSLPLKRPMARNRSVASDGEEGLAGEAMRGNGTKTPILRVDASKMRLGR